jgi:F0F1-type ATP synthase assembly protein I
MVLVKLCIILLVIAVGVFYIDFDNWTAPNGVSGVLKGVSPCSLPTLVLMLFLPRRKNARIHKGFYPGYDVAIIICTVLYIIIALVLTGMVNYSDPNVGDPLLYVFEN